MKELAAEWQAFPFLSLTISFLKVITPYLHYFTKQAFCTSFKQ